MNYLKVIAGPLIVIILDKNSFLTECMMGEDEIIREKRGQQPDSKSAHEIINEKRAPAPQPPNRKLAHDYSIIDMFGGGTLKFEHHHEITLNGKAISWDRAQSIDGYSVYLDSQNGLIYIDKKELSLTRRILKDVKKDSAGNYALTLKPKEIEVDGNVALQETIEKVKNKDALIAKKNAALARPEVPPSFPEVPRHNPNIELDAENSTELKHNRKIHQSPSKEPEIIEEPIIRPEDREIRRNSYQVIEPHLAMPAGEKVPTKADILYQVKKIKLHIEGIDESVIQTKIQNQLENRPEYVPITENYKNWLEEENKLTALKEAQKTQLATLSEKIDAIEKADREAIYTFIPKLEEVTEIYEEGIKKYKKLSADIVVAWEEFAGRQLKLKHVIWGGILTGGIYLFIRNYGLTNVLTSIISKLKGVPKIFEQAIKSSNETPKVPFTFTGSNPAKTSIVSVLSYAALKAAIKRRR